VVVVLGTPTPDSSEVYALTVTSGDPTWAGPLAGIALGMPVYHILEPEIKEQVDPAVYSEQVALSEMVLDSAAIAEVVHKVRNESSNSV
jgi:glycine reductase